MQLLIVRITLEKGHVKCEKCRRFCRSRYRLHHVAVMRDAGEIVGTVRVVQSTNTRESFVFTSKLNKKSGVEFYDSHCSYALLEKAFGL